MPNALAHLGIHAVLARSVIPRADLSAVWLGYLLPDLPWILQRAVRGLAPDISLIDLRVYAAVQSALVFCVIAAAACACLTPRPGRIFAIVAFGCLVHLLLDASQTKWANGVLLFAPLEWRPLNFGLYWPEDPATLWLSAFGLAYVLVAATTMSKSPIRLHRPPLRQAVFAAALALAYVVGPVAFLQAAERADVHYASTLRDSVARPKKEIGFDRADLRIEGDSAFLDIWTGETLRLLADTTDLQTGKVSVRGHFVDMTTVRADALHGHPAKRRQMLTFVGLALIVVWWGWMLVRGYRRANR